MHINADLPDPTLSANLKGKLFFLRQNKQVTIPKPSNLDIFLCFPRRAAPFRGEDGKRRIWSPSLTKTNTSIHFSVRFPVSANVSCLILWFVVSCLSRVPTVVMLSINSLQAVVFYLPSIFSTEDTVCICIHFTKHDRRGFISNETSPQSYKTGKSQCLANVGETRGALNLLPKLHPT